MDYTNEQMIQRYEKYLRGRRKLDDKTIRNYIYDLKTYNTFLNGIHFFDATEQDIRGYIQNKINRKNSENRIMFSISTLSSFYKYLVNNKYTDNNPIENLPRPKAKKNDNKEYLKRTQIKEIKNKLREHNNVQLEVFFGILIASMPMKQYISKIEWRRINWKNKYVEVEINEEERAILYLDDYCVDRLTALRKERKDKGIKRKQVFLTRHNGNWGEVSDPTISYWLNKIKNIIGLNKLDFNIMKRSTIHYWQTSRRFSDEKINKIIEHGRGFPIELRASILKEVEELCK